MRFKMWIFGNFKQHFKNGLAIFALFLFSVRGGYAESVTLNLKGADINAVIGTVAEVTGKNFIVDPRVKGKVTIISARPMDENEIYQVFLSVLEVHGFTAVPAGDVIKILPDSEAKHNGVPTATARHPGEGDEAVTRVIEIKHVTAAQLVPILRPLVPPQGHLAAYPASNMLIVSDRASNIERLVSIINRIDQPTSGEIEFIPLQHASATDVARVLTTLQQQERKKEPKSEIPILVADERSNSVLIGGDKAERLQLRAIITHLDTPTETVGDTHVIYLRYAKAKDLVPVLTGVQTSKAQAAKGKGKGAPAQEEVFNIQADETTNALVITAPASVYRSLESVIHQLDVRRAQVLVEAIIAEVSTDAAAQLGIQWAASGDPSGSTPIGAVNFGANPSIAEVAGSIASNTAPAIGEGITLGIGRIVKNGLSFAGLLRALETDGFTNVLSTPNLVTLDNEEAQIFVGDEVSIPSGTFTSTGTSSTPDNPFTTFKRTKVGIDLKVKPQISEGNAIKLEIEQKVDGVKSGTAGAQDLVTSERSIKTSVMVDNGKILVLGGLIKDDLVENASKVPLLGDIPILGALFRYKSTTKVKTNLMVFLRPVVLRDAESGMAITSRKYDFIRSKQLETRDRGVALLPYEDSPLIPEMDEFLELPPPFEDTTK